MIEAKELKDIIFEWLQTDRKTPLKIPFAELNLYANVLDELGFGTKRDGALNLMHNGNDWDTNGWQVDFWWTITRIDKKYILAGSLWYSKEWTLSLK